MQRFFVGLLVFTGLMCQMRPTEAAMLVSSATRGVAARSTAGDLSDITSLQGSYTMDISVGDHSNWDYARGYQMSEIQPLWLQGFGSAEITLQGQPDGVADSFFDVMIELDAPHRYTLVGSLIATGDAEFGTAHADFEITGPGISESYHADFFQNAGWNLSGTLAPGTYNVSAVAHANDVSPFAGFQDALAAFRFNMVLTEGSFVPEPTGFIIWAFIGLACGGIGWYRRRKQ